jgi:hypothetical protein
MAGAPPSIPQDMRDLLIRLDQRVDDGFKSMNDKLDAMNRRADGLETRVRDLEVWRSEVQGGAKGIGLGWKVGSVIVGVVIGFLGMLGLQLAVAPSKPIAKQTETIERSIQLPVHSRQ